MHFKFNLSAECNFQRFSLQTAIIFYVSSGDNGQLVMFRLNKY